MAELILSEEADDDLDGIYDWSVEQFGREVAEDYSADFLQAFDRLRAFPESGVVRRDVPGGYRALDCRSHRVFYRIDGDLVRVVRILHFAMSASLHLD